MVFDIFDGLSSKALTFRGHGNIRYAKINT